MKINFPCWEQKAIEASHSQLQTHNQTSRRKKNMLNPATKVSPCLFAMLCLLFCAQRKTHN